MKVSRGWRGASLDRTVNSKEEIEDMRVNRRRRTARRRRAGQLLSSRSGGGVGY